MKKPSKYIIHKRFRRRLTSKSKQKHKKIRALGDNLALNKELEGDLSYEMQINKWLPKNIKFILSKIEGVDYYYSDFNVDFETSEYRIKIPKNFCLNSHRNISLRFIYSLVNTILSDAYRNIIIDYSNCKEIDLSAQIFLDIILIDLFKFRKKRSLYKKTKPFLRTIGGRNIEDENIQKIIFSIGSPAVINNRAHKFDDIVPYKLCIHNKEKKSINNDKRKEIDATDLVQHVISSLATIQKKLSIDTIENLSTVFGEILINAEEHSTQNYRYSTGYFQQISNDKLKSAYGIYHLVILNFGDSIYQKFKSPKCTNYEIKERMFELSRRYTANKWFSKSFDEETLWTLYALQEGITSIPIEDYKRGNGSIRFIESFFNLKSNSADLDNISRLSLISGNTNIIFDGKYEIRDKFVGKDSFKVMTFNDSGNIEDKPDRKYVKHIKDCFPGTIISAKILITKDDVI
ncbi:hypothetical protein [Flavobacterium sp. GNP001]